MRRIIGDAELWLGDSMEIMAASHEELAEKAALIVCDPPYLLTSGGDGDSEFCARFNGGEYNNNGNLFGEDIPDWNEFMPLFYQCLRRPAHCYVMANNRNVQAMLNAASASSFGFHNLLPWRKGTYTPNRWYMKGTEYTGFFYKGKAFQINNCSSRDDIYMPQVDESSHPTEKPVMLMRYYIENSSQPGETVFDPFMGSGTTGVAALQSGRKFIGIERDEKFFEMACERIGRAVNGAEKNLFAR